MANASHPINKAGVQAYPTNGPAWEHSVQLSIGRDPDRIEHPSSSTDNYQVLSRAALLCIEQARACISEVAEKSRL